MPRDLYDAAGGGKKPKRGLLDAAAGKRPADVEPPEWDPAFDEGMPGDKPRRPSIELLPTVAPLPEPISATDPRGFGVRERDPNGGPARVRRVDTPLVSLPAKVDPLRKEAAEKLQREEAERRVKQREHDLATLGPLGTGEAPALLEQAFRDSSPKGRQEFWSNVLAMGVESGQLKTPDDIERAYQRVRELQWRLFRDEPGLFQGDGVAFKPPGWRPEPSTAESLFAFGHEAAYEAEQFMTFGLYDDFERWAFGDERFKERLKMRADMQERTPLAAGAGGATGSVLGLVATMGATAPRILRGAELLKDTAALKALTSTQAWKAALEVGATGARGVASARYLLPIAMRSPAFARAARGLLQQSAQGGALFALYGFLQDPRTATLDADGNIHYIGRDGKTPTSFLSPGERLENATHDFFFGALGTPVMNAGRRLSTALSRSWEPLLKSYPEVGRRFGASVGGAIEFGALGAIPIPGSEHATWVQDLMAGRLDEAKIKLASQAIAGGLVKAASWPTKAREAKARAEFEARALEVLKEFEAKQEAALKQQAGQAKVTAVETGQVELSEVASEGRVKVARETAEKAAAEGKTPEQVLEAVKEKLEQTPPEKRVDPETGRTVIEGPFDVKASEKGLVEPEAKPLVDAARAEGKEVASSGVDKEGNPVAVVFEPGKEGVEVRRGKPAYEADVFQGRGATLEEVYGPENVKAGRATPIFGPGQYYAPDEASAAIYAGKAGKVTKERVRLENPLVIDNDRAWRDLLVKADALQLSSVDGKPGNVKRATMRLQEYVKKQGYDGVVIEVPAAADMNAKGEPTKRLAESFGHSQVVKFEAAAKPEAAKRKILTAESAEDLETARRYAKGYLEDGDLAGARTALEGTRKAIAGQEADIKENGPLSKGLDRHLRALRLNEAELARVVERLEAEQKPIGQRKVVEPIYKGEGQEGSAYQGEKLEDLLPTVEREQVARRRTMFALEQQLAEGVKPNREKAIKAEVERLAGEIERVYEEVENAGGAASRELMLRRVEMTANPVKGAEAPVPAKKKPRAPEEPAKPATTLEAYLTQYGPDAMRRGRLKKTLETTISVDGKPMTRAELVEKVIAEGGKVLEAGNGEKRLTKPDGGFWTEGDITATAMQYARLLARGDLKPQAEAPSKVDAPGEKPVLKPAPIQVWNDWRAGKATTEQAREKIRQLRKHAEESEAHAAAQSVKANRERVLKEGRASRRLADQFEREVDAAEARKQPAEPPKAPKAAPVVVAPTPGPAPKLERVATIDGAKTEIPVPGGQARPAKYALIELADLKPSHDPTQAFEKTRGYPTENRLQERDYQKDVGERSKVEEIARSMRPEEMLNTSPRATEGPPTTTPEAVVINGNGRSMGLKLAGSRGGLEAYRRVLRERAEQFGLKAEDVDRLKEPVLVRVVEMDPTSKEAADFGRQGNIVATQSVSPMRRAARYAELIGEKLVETVNASPESTLGEILNDRTKAREFRAALERDIAATERAEFFKEDGTFTEAGKELAQNVLLLRAMPLELVEKMTPQLRNTVSQSVPQLVQMQRIPALKPLADATRKAAEFFMGQLEGGAVSPGDYFGQGNMFGGKAELPPLERMFVDFLYRERGSPRRMRDRMASLIEQYEQSRGMFPESEESLARRVLEVPERKSSGETFGFPTDGGPPERTEPIRLKDTAPREREVYGSIDPLAPNGPPIIGDDYWTSLAPIGAPGKFVRASDVVRALQDAGLADVVIRTGRFRQKALGIFKVRPNVVRLKDANNIPVAAHEIGHNLWKFVIQNGRQLPDVLRGLPMPVRRALLTLGHDLYGSTQPAAGYHNEGFAELLRFWITKRDHLVSRAPAALDWLERTLLPSQPALAKRLTKARDLAQRYANQGAVKTAQSRFWSKPEQQRGFLARTREWFVRNWVEEAHILDKIDKVAEEHAIAQGKTLRGSQKPGLVFQWRRRTAPGVVNTMVHEHMVNVYGIRTGTPGLDAIWEIASKGGDSLAFTTYLYAMQAREMLTPKVTPSGAVREAKNPALTLKQAEQVITELENPHFQIAAKHYQDWWRDALNYVRELGGLTNDQYDAIVGSHDHYLPLFRVRDSLDPAEIGSSLAEAARGGTPLKRRKGGNQEIIDPRITTIQQLDRLVRHAHERQVARTLGELVLPKGAGGAGIENMGKWIEEVPRDLVPNRVSIEQIAKELERNGANLDAANLDALITFFTPTVNPKTGDPILSFTDRRGDLRWVQVSKDVYESLQGLDLYRLPKLLDATLGRLTRIKRLGTTGLRAGFALVTNPQRDLLNFLIQSSGTDSGKGFAEGVYRYFQGLAQRMTGGEYADVFKGMGLEMTMPLGIDLATTRKAAHGLGSSRLGRWARNPVRQAYETLANAFQFFEGGTRLAEFITVANEVGWKPGQSMDMDQALEIALATKRVTTDFTATGRMGRVANQLIPFFNARIQGARTAARKFKEHPLATSIKALGLLTAPSMLLYLRNREDKKWQEKPMSDKLLNEYLPGDVKWALPQEWNVAFRMPFIIAAEYERTGDWRVLRDGLEVMRHTLGAEQSMAMPSGVVTMREQDRNRDLFFNRPIVPRTLEGRPAAEQIGPYTTGAAQFIAKVAAAAPGGKDSWLASPLRVDSMIRSIGGGLAGDTAQFLDEITGYRRDQREFEKADIPFIGRLWDREVQTTSQSVDFMFEERADLLERQQSAENPLNRQERRRLRVLNDAAAAVRVLAEARNKLHDIASRKAVQEEIWRVARAANDGSLGSIRAKIEASRAERRLREVEKGAGR